MLQVTLTEKMLSVLESCKTYEQVITLDAWFQNTVEKLLDEDSAVFYYRARSLKVARLKYGNQYRCNHCRSWRDYFLF